MRIGATGCAAGRGHDKRVSCPACRHRCCRACRQRCAGWCCAGRCCGSRSWAGAAGPGTAGARGSHGAGWPGKHQAIARSGKQAHFTSWVGVGWGYAAAGSRSMAVAVGHMQILSTTVRMVVMNHLCVNGRLVGRWWVCSGRGLRCSGRIAWVDWVKWCGRVLCGTWGTGTWLGRGVGDGGRGF